MSGDDETSLVLKTGALRLMSDQTLAELKALVGKGIISPQSERVIVTELERREFEAWQRAKK